MKIINAILLTNAFLLFFGCVSSAGLSIHPALTLDYGYNDNIYNNAEESAETENKAADTYMEPCFELELEKTILPSYSITLTGEADREIYSSHNDADNMTLSGAFGLSGMLTSCDSMKLSYRYSLYEYGDPADKERDDTYDYAKNDYTLRLKHYFGSNTAVGYNFRIYRKEYTNAGREDDFISHAAVISRTFFDRFMLQLEYQPQENDSDMPEYDYDNTLLGSLFLVSLSEQTYLMNLAQYHIREYPDRLTADGENNRKDGQYFFISSLNRSFTEVISAEMYYTYIDNTSNDDTAEYVNGIYGISLEFGF
ncbi:MAG: hypothetical protein JXJ19_05510 [Elusimicrobia bacterium]|nr:hypothetical protein [Elusimicrobiota bacterium]